MTEPEWKNSLLPPSELTSWALAVVFCELLSAKVDAPTESTRIPIQVSKLILVRSTPWHFDGVFLIASRALSALGESRHSVGQEAGTSGRLRKQSRGVKMPVRKTNKNQVGRWDMFESTEHLGMA